jgi:hypothetical protein
MKKSALPLFVRGLLAACQTAPLAPSLRVTAPAQPVQPVTVALVATADPNAPRVNQWGGEVPEAAPVRPLGEDSLPPLKES